MFQRALDSSKKFYSLLAIAIVLVYGKTLGFEFLSYDDYFHVTNNALIDGGDLSSLGRIWSESLHGLYVPVTYTFWLLEAKLSLLFWGRLSPGFFHAVSVLLHLTALVSADRYLSARFENKRAVRLGLLVFAFHPVLIESVAWISEQKGLLSSALGFLAMSLFARKSKVSYFAFALAILAKPTAVVFPFFALILEKDDFKTKLVRLAPVLLLAGVAGIVMPRLQPAEEVLHVVEFWRRAQIALDALGFYLLQIFRLDAVSIDYGRNSEWVVAAGQVFYLAMGAGAVAFLLLSRSLVARGALCAFVAIAPNLGLIPFSFQDHSTVADRYAYLPYLFLFVTTALSIERRTSRAVFAVMVPLFAVVTFLRLDPWHDSQTLMEETLKRNPRSLLATTNLAYVAEARGLQDEALRWYRESLKIQPSAAALNGIGVILIQQGKLTEAVSWYRDLIAIRPRFAAAHRNLGVALQTLGQTKEAQAAFAREAELGR